MRSGSYAVADDQVNVWRTEPGWSAAGVAELLEILSPGRAVQAARSAAASCLKQNLNTLVIKNWRTAAGALFVRNCGVRM
jgi:hypothetical protein